MEATTSERRREARQPAHLTVSYASRSLEVTGLATNLSPRGVFIESDLLDVVGTRAVLLISDGALFRMQARGKVVWAVTDRAQGLPGMGVRFVELSPVAARWIELYCTTFSVGLRVVLAHPDRTALDRASRVVEDVGANPICLRPEQVSPEAVTRLRPHMVVLGDEEIRRGGWENTATEHTEVLAWRDATALAEAIVRAKEKHGLRDATRFPPAG